MNVIIKNYNGKPNQININPLISTHEELIQILLAKQIFINNKDYKVITNEYIANTKVTIIYVEEIEEITDDEFGLG